MTAFRAVGGGESPQLVDQPLAGHDLVRVQEQRGEDNALLDGHEGDRPMLVDHLEGTEDPELHVSGFTASKTS